jgi:hypothetical protein
MQQSLPLVGHSIVVFYSTLKPRRPIAKQPSRERVESRHRRLCELTAVSSQRMRDGRSELWFFFSEEMTPKR